MAGDPINVSTGNKFLQSTDYSASPWLTFRRFYNSNLTNFLVTNAGTTTNMGAGWSNSFSRSLLLLDSPLATIGVQRPDGRQYTFHKNSGVWSSDPDVLEKLTEQDDAKGNPTGFTLWVAELNHTEVYSAAGLLLSVTDLNGQGVTLTYSTASTPNSIAPSAGLLLNVTDSQGRQLNFTYNSSGNVSTLTLPDGGVLAYNYDSNINLTSVTYPDSKVRTYTYNNPQNIAGSVVMTNALTGIVDEAGVAYESTTYNGKSGSSSGYATSSSFAGGANAVQVFYGSTGPAPWDGNGTATIEYALGQTSNATIATEQGVNKVTSVSQSCGQSCNQPFKSRSYDANGYPNSTMDWNGYVTATTFDANGLLDVEVDAQGTTSQRTTNTTWNAGLRVPLTRTVSNASGTVVRSTQWVYNAAGQILARCDIDPTNSAASGYSCSATGTVPPGVRRNTYTYCTAVDAMHCPLVGLLLTETGPRTDITQTTTYSYYMTSSATSCGTPGAACYRAGDLFTVTDPLGRMVTIASYDADGRITRSIDANGIDTDTTYTPRGWVASSNVGGALTQFTYTAYGAVQTVTDPDGVITTYGYDQAHRLNKITDALGNYILYTLDAAGNEIGEQIYDGTGTSHSQITSTFNALSELTTVVDGLGKTVFNASASGSYDAKGNLILSSDGLGVQRQLGYDALNRLVQTVDNYKGADATTQNTTAAYQYDSLDRLIKVTDPTGLNTTYSYDGLSNTTLQQSPDTGATKRTFDAAGDVLTTTDAKGITATNTYDALDRLISTSYPDSTQGVTYHYDDPNSTTNCTVSYFIGHLTRIVENTVTTTYCYDARGNVIQKQQVTSAGSDVTKFSITNAGRLNGITYPSGTEVTYTRDGDGRIQGVNVAPRYGTATAVTSNVTYQPFGPVSSYTLGNTQQIVRTYNANYRLTDLTSPTFNLHIARDVMGDVAAIGSASGANPATETYGYDPLYRLTTVTEANGTALETVTYNQNGDRISKAGSGLSTGTYSYKTGTHQLIATGSAARAADANGNTTAISLAGSAYGFGYNDRNRMSIAQLAGSTIASYAYNALNQRIQKVAASVTERYDYSEDGQILAEYGASNRDYIWMDGVPVANVDTSGTTSTLAYVTADQLGTPRVVADANGNAEWKNNYQSNPWNEQSPTSNGYVYNLGLPGQYFDKETGLFYNYHRDYDSSTGRYIESDPVGLLSGSSTYAYVVNTPLIGTDSLGMACNVRGCWNTPDELASAGIGDYAGYYAKACAGGDPYACRAGEVATDTGNGLRGMLSEVTNRKLALSIAMHQPPYCPPQFLKDDLRRKMQNIRNDLMKARINQLSSGTPDSPIQVNKQDISAFHHAVFEQDGAGADAFGGDLWDATHLQSVTNYNWCEFPACKR